MGVSTGGGGQTKANPSGWSVDTIKDYVIGIIDERDRRYEQRFEAQQTALKDALQAAEKAVGAALTAADRAVAKAEAAAERRFESVNEFRATLSDQASNLLPRAEADARFLNLGDKVESLAKSIDRGEGKSVGLNAGWVILLGAIGTLGVIATIVLAFLK